MAVTNEEILVFIGINLLIGYHVLSTMHLNWNTGDDLGVKPVQRAMSRDRFKLISSNLHLNDNSKIA